MLVCPHCQFENPDTHNFCQKCGESLTEATCPGCAATVPFSAEYCPLCGTAVGVVWRALLFPSLHEQNVTLVNETQISQPPSCLPQTIGLPASKYLDTQQRYQLLEPLPESISSLTETRVIDCQPFQPSLIEVFYQQQVGYRNPSPEPESPVQEEMLPTAARPYLELQERYPSLSLPLIHDAWEQEGLNVVLLEDRRHLPLLIDCWADTEVLPLQILHWLHEMVELWAVLQPMQCSRSLLELENLHVDEDNLLCLQRLYMDDSEAPVELSELGRLWQALFRLSQRTQNADLAVLCSEVEGEVIVTLEQVRSRIETIAMSLQSDSKQGMLPEPFDPQSASPAMQNLRQPVEDEAADLLEPDEPDEPDDANSEAPLDLPAPPSLGCDDDSLNDSDDLPTVVLPMRLISIEDAGRTDIGRQRDHNEDCYSIQTDVKKLESPQGRKLQAKGLYILCDGMGGHAGGEVASALAVETLRKYFDTHWQDSLPNETIIRGGVYQANQAIYDLNQQSARSGSGRMGTTLVLVLIQDTEAAIAHVGDSRLYRLSRRQGLEQITVDHEVGQREIQRGVDPAIAYARPDAYQLTQALGPRDENFVNPEVKFLELNEDTVLLLCSDGLTDNDLLETHQHSHLDALLHPNTNLDQGVSQLIELANQQNGHDNITVIAIRTRVRPNLEQFNRL